VSPSFFWAGQAFVRHKILPWEFMDFAPEQQGWLIAIMEMEIELEMKEQEKYEGSG